MFELLPSITRMAAAAVVEVAQIGLIEYKVISYVDGCMHACMLLCMWLCICKRGWLQVRTREDCSGGGGGSDSLLS